MSSTADMHERQMWRDSLDMRISRSRLVASENVRRSRGLRIRTYPIRKNTFHSFGNQRNLPRRVSIFLVLLLRLCHLRLTSPFSRTAWENLRPKLEPVLEKFREERLSKEKQMRKMKRMATLYSFYSKITRDITGYSPDESYSSAPSSSEFYKHSVIADLIQIDTADVTEETWMTVANEVHDFVLRKHHDTLKKLADILDGTNLIPEPLMGEFVSTPSEQQDQEAVGPVPERAEVERLSQRVSLATSVFRCDCEEQVLWFPNLLYHTKWSHSNSCDKLKPMAPKEEAFVIRLLQDLGLDESTCSYKDANKGPADLLCLRCDERLAIYRSFPDMVSPFVPPNVQDRR